MITEFGVAARRDVPFPHLGSQRGSPPVFTWELGEMVNVSRRSAIGGSMLVAAVDEGARLAIRSRYRRSLGPNELTALDLSAGLFLRGISDNGHYAYPRFTGTVAITFADWFAVSVNVDQERFRVQEIDPQARLRGALRTVQVSRTDIAWRVGASLGSYPGAIVGTTVPLVGLVLLAALSRGWGGGSSGSTGSWDYPYMAIRGGSR